MVWRAATEDAVRALEPSLPPEKAERVRALLAEALRTVATTADAAWDAAMAMPRVAVRSADASAWSSGAGELDALLESALPLDTDPKPRGRKRSRQQILDTKHDGSGHGLAEAEPPMWHLAAMGLHGPRIAGLRAQMLAAVAGARLDDQEEENGEESAGGGEERGREEGEGGGQEGGGGGSEQSEYAAMLRRLTRPKRATRERQKALVVARPEAGEDAARSRRWWSAASAAAATERAEGGMLRADRWLGRGRTEGVVVLEKSHDAWLWATRVLEHDHLREGKTAPPRLRLRLGPGLLSLGPGLELAFAAATAHLDASQHSAFADEADE